MLLVKETNEAEHKMRGDEKGEARPCVSTVHHKLEDFFALKIVELFFI